MILSICLILVMSTMYISARSVGSYDITMKRFGGVSYTDSLYKENQSRAVNNNTYIGGGYSMGCAIYRGETRISEIRTIYMGDRVYLNYHAPSDAEHSRVRLGAWSKITTYVKVQTQGTWSPDEY